MTDNYKVLAMSDPTRFQDDLNEAAKEKWELVDLKITQYSDDGISQPFYSAVLVTKED